MGIFVNIPMRLRHLIEKIINVRDKDEKEQYVDVVWDMMQQSYQPVGGFKSATSPDHLIDTTGMWKLVRRDGKIVAAKLYKDQHGRKSVAGGTDGSEQGKTDLKKLILDDMKQRRAWAEVSDKMTHIYLNRGAIKIPNKYAAELTGKEIIDLDPDGYHYTRLIQGTPHEKLIVGFPKGFERFFS